MCCYFSFQFGYSNVYVVMEAVDVMFVYRGARAFTWVVYWVVFSEISILLISILCDTKVSNHVARL